MIDWKTPKFLPAPAMVLPVLLAVALGCGPAEAPPDARRAPVRNLLLITIDTLRADHVGAYGDRAATPNLDRLAAAGTVFERCIAQAPLTLPSHTTILSGTSPLHHRVRDNGGLVVPDELELVSEILNRQGFSTGAFIGAYVLHSKWGLDQGFDRYADDFERSRYDRLLLQNSKRAEEVVGPAAAWIEAAGERRFFAWVHVFDPHTPYDPPPPFDVDPRGAYSGEVAYVDHVLGGFLDRLESAGLLADTLVLVTSDHGEGLGQHGELEHGFFVYDTTIKVPLIVRAPFAPARARWSGLVEHTDLVPTMLEAAGVDVPPAVQGRSLWPVLAGGDPEARTAAYAETFYPRLHYGWSELRALYRGDRKLIAAPRPELFDLAADPGELRDLAGDPASARELAAMSCELEALMAELSSAALTPAAAFATAEDRAALEALGYVTTRVERSGEDVLADPKDKLGVFNRLAEAGGLVGEGRHEGAIAIASEAVAADPDLVEGHILLGNAQRALGRLTAAIASYRRALELKPDANFVMVDLVASLLEGGEAGEALAEGRIFLDTFPDDPVLNRQVSEAAVAVGELEIALDLLEAALAAEPDDGHTLTRAGELALRLGNGERADALLRRALEVAPGSRGAWYLLGKIAAAEGRGDEALASFQREADEHPRAYLAAFDAALILAGRGEREQALRYCRQAVAAEPPMGGPYFMLASDLLDRGERLEEAIALCRTGIAAEPVPQSRLVGYQVLLPLLERTGRPDAYANAAREAAALQRSIDER